MSLRQLDIYRSIIIAEQLPLTKSLDIDTPLVHFPSALDNHWLTRRQVGCVYAQALNTNPNEHGLDSYVIAGESTALVGDMAAEINDHARTAAESEGIEAVSLLLPGVADHIVLCQLILRLSTFSNWSLRPTGTPHVDYLSGDTYALVGLDYLLTEHTPSAVLGLANLDFLPATRRGPVASLELRTKPDEARPSYKRAGQPLVSHLAQVPFRGQFAQKSDQMWQQTQKLRLAVLGRDGRRDDERAKAEVTYAMPWADWTAVSQIHA